MVMTVKRPLAKPVIECRAICAMRDEIALTMPVSFALSQGAFMQLRGANGAGKSTLLRQLAGLAPSQEGCILLSDTPCASHQIAQHLAIGYLGHADGLQGDLTGYENFELLTGIGREMIAQRALYQRHVATYSAGQRQRLVLEMLDDRHDIWLLDEPAASLDDVNIAYLEERIAGYLALGGIVIASTHSPLAERLVSQIVHLTPVQTLTREALA